MSQRNLLGVNKLIVITQTFCKMADSSPKPGIVICCISLNSSDKIRLLGLPPAMVAPIRAAINGGWGKIQNEGDYYGSYEFKLKGNPWYGNGEDAVRSRRLLAAILTTMARNGWNLIQACDISKKRNDKDSLFFESGIPDPEVQMFAVSLNMSDRIRVIDAPGFYPFVKAAVMQYWVRGIQNEREYYGSLELKLKGDPWWADGPEVVTVRMLLCQMIANLRSQGFKLYTSADISYGNFSNDDNRQSELESFVFRKVTSVWN